MEITAPTSDRLAGLRRAIEARPDDGRIWWDLGDHLEEDGDPWAEPVRQVGRQLARIEGLKQLVERVAARPKAGGMVGYRDLLETAWQDAIYVDEAGVFWPDWGELDYLERCYRDRRQFGVAGQTYEGWKALRHLCMTDSLPVEIRRLRLVVPPGTAASRPAVIGLDLGIRDSFIGDSTAAEIANPSWLTLRPEDRHLRWGAWYDAARFFWMCRRYPADSLYFYGPEGILSWRRKDRHSFAGAIRDARNYPPYPTPDSGGPGRFELADPAATLGVNPLPPFCVD